MSKEFYMALGKTATWPNFPSESHFPPSASITFDDVLVIPGVNTEIESRTVPDLSVQFGPFHLRTPIVTAPMDTISGEKMIRKMAKFGGIGSLPRNKDFSSTLALCEKLSTDNIPCLYALGLNSVIDQATQLKEHGAEMVLLDVAHGGMKQVVRMASEIKSKLGLTIMAGNIVTFPQAMAYKQAGIEVARVGVGPGGACKTRLIAGVGFPQMSAIFETTESGIYVVADGGIRQPADVVKALAAGANMVMIGSMFAGTEETPGEVVNGMKQFRGQASTSYMLDNGVMPGEYRAAEGVDIQVPTKGSVEHIIAEINGGLRSGMSYVGAANIKELQQKANFIFTSPAAQQENKPHILGK